MNGQAHTSAKDVSPNAFVSMIKNHDELMHCPRRWKIGFSTAQRKIKEADCLPSNHVSLCKQSPQKAAHFRGQ